MQKNNTWVTIVMLIVGSILLFGCGIGRAHLFDWDEINFAESAREMLITGDLLNVQVNYQTFWEKPPFFIWLLSLSMSVFGVNEFAARFPNVIAGVLTLLVLFFIGKRHHSQRFGRLWAVTYACSFLPFFYFKSSIIDPWFNLFIFLGIYFILLYTAPNRREKGWQSATLSAVFIGLATLTKGPVGLLVFGLCFLVFGLLNRFKFNHFKWSDVGLFAVCYAIVGGLWFILQMATGNMSIMQDFIVYQIRLFQTQDAGHGGFPLYHFVILFFGVFPASIFALPTMRKRIFALEKDEMMAHLYKWMMITLWVVLILFSIVRTKIVHYSSMCYFPITFLGAWYMMRWHEGRVRFHKWMDGLLLLVAVPLGLAVTALPFIDRFKHLLIPYIQDEFAVHNLEATSDWMGFEWITGVILIVGVLLFTLLRGKNQTRALGVLLGSSLLFVFMGSYFITPQVEKYSQKAAIDFYESKKGEDCYIYPIHKSYAHYFYSERLPQNNESDSDYLKSGNIDKPTYFVLKHQHTEEEEFVQEVPDAVKLYEKNGFIFYARYPKGTLQNTDN